MLDVALYVAGFVVLIPTSLMVVAAIRAYKKVKSDQKKIEWVTLQLNRALDQISSNDDDRILAGLQTIAALNDPGLRLKALPRLVQLVQDDNPLIKRYAQLTVKKLSTQSEDDENNDDRNPEIL